MWLRISSCEALKAVFGKEECAKALLSCSPLDETSLDVVVMVKDLEVVRRGLVCRSRGCFQLHTPHFRAGINSESKSQYNSFQNFTVLTEVSEDGFPYPFVIVENFRQLPRTPLWVNVRGDLMYSPCWNLLSQFLLFSRIVACLSGLHKLTSFLLC
jgi:hypothetical protein